MFSFPFHPDFNWRKSFSFGFMKNLKGLFDLQGILFPEIGKELENFLLDLVLVFGRLTAPRDFMLITQ